MLVEYADANDMLGRTARKTGWFFIVGLEVIEKQKLNIMINKYELNKYSIMLLSHQRGVFTQDENGRPSGWVVVVIAGKMQCCGYQIG